MKRTLSLLMIVMILLMVFFITIVPSDAMMPLAPLAGALTKEQIVTGVLVSLNMISLTESAPDLIDDIMSLPQFLNFNANDYPIYYTPDGEYAFLIGNQQLDAIYSTITGKIPYGTTTSHGILQNYYVNWVPMPEFVHMNSVYQSYLSTIKSNCSFVIVNVRPMQAGRTWVSISGLNEPVIDEQGKSVTGSSSQYANIQFNSDHSIYSHYINDPTGSMNINLNAETAYHSGSVIVPVSTWDDRYIKPTGINYNTWPQQVSGGYAIKIPTKNEIDPITDNEIAVVDEDTLVTLLPDDVRVPDRVTEIVPVPDPIPVTPYDPTIPVTDPVTDPITDVASETWLDRLLHKFVNLFILPENYFTEQFQAIQNEIPMLAFPNQIIADLRSISSLGSYYLDDITVDAWGGTHTIVSFQGLRDSLPTVHNWIRGVIFILLLLYNYAQVYKAIRGNDYGFALHQSNTAVPGTSLSKEVINR